MELLTVTAENFEQEVLHSELPVLVDFWAAWCGPCKMLSPIIEELAGEVDHVRIGKLNVDEQQALAQKYGVMSIPTMILFKNGEIAGTTVGLQSKQQLLDFISR